MISCFAPPDRRGTGCCRYQPSDSRLIGRIDAVVGFSFGLDTGDNMGADA